MKIGNLSQSIVPVPNFFLNKDQRDLETFHINRRRRYYREKDLFQMTHDINLNNNYRNNQRIIEEFNKTKYIPPYSLKTNQTTKNLSTETNEYTKMMNFLKTSDVVSNRNPELREEIKANVQNLLDRINSDYDLKRWSDFDTKTTGKIFQSNNPLNNQISIKDEETQQFTNTLRHKLESLTSIPKETKDKLLSNKLALPLVNKHKIKSNTATDLMYSRQELEYSSEDRKLIDENKYIQERFSNTTLYKDFPSPTRMEFNRKVIGKKRIGKQNFPRSDISKANYNFTEKELFNCTSEMFSRPLHKDHFK